MPKGHRNHRPRRLGMIIATAFGMCAGLCVGAVACIGIAQYLSK